jgi:sugar lactone lactonase YvrE
MMEAQVILESGDRLGECPLWDEREGKLLWVDIHGPALKRLDPASGEVRVTPLPEPIGSFALRSGGGLLAAMQSGFYLLDAESGALERFARPDPWPAEHRLNDGRCDRAGRFWAGTLMEPDFPPTGTLYRLSPDRGCEAMLGGIAVPNSLAWSPDGRRMYFADSPRDTIWVFDYDEAAGEISNRRVFARTPTGHPDGSCVDVDGCLWNAEYGGSRVVRYTPEGAIDRVIELPVRKPTCCCFGGERLDTLFITSAAQGGVLAARPGVSGLVEARFAG